MTCTAHCCAINETFDRQVAEQELARYRRKGPSPSTRRLLAALREAGIDGATVLDVGGGIGTVAHELLGAGAAHGTVVDASTFYLAAAQEEAERRNEGGRLALMQGDFLALAPTLPTADVVTLDKVVCCYPDMAGLLGASTGRAKRLFGIVYPRQDWWLRLGIAAQNALRRMRGSAFRVYVFPHSAIDRAIQRAGFALRQRHRGLVWIAALYERMGPPA